MSLARSHKEIIVERLMLKYLLDGIIPTSDQIEDDLYEYQKKYIDLGLPTSYYESHEVEHGDYSSVSKLDTSISSFAKDIDIVSKEIYSLATKSSRLHERWINELQRIYSRAKKVNHEIDSLLLLNQDTSGYYAVVGDAFPDLTKVDTANTTARVDILESAVLLNSGNQYKEFSSIIDTSNVRESDVSFNVITKASDTSYNITDASSKLSNIFKYDQSKWTAKISTSRSGNMIAELKARISSELQEITKVVLTYTGPITSENANITLQYSPNGYTWEIPPYNATKTLTRNMSWHFDPKDIKWIKFIFYKPSHDSGKYQYEYSIQNIKVYGNTFSQTLGNVFVSKGLSANKPDDTKHIFSKVSLEACEELHKETNIKYYIAGSEDNSTYTDWIPIQPSNKNSIKYPKIVNLGVAAYKNNEDSDIEKIDSSTDIDKITRTFTNSNISGYRFSGPEYAFVNTAIEASSLEELDTIRNTVVLWRNTREKDSYPDTLTVRDKPRGWSSDGKQYICFFEFLKETELDFGDTVCSIDGQSISGKVNISPGIHKFSTSNDNWFDISENISNYTGDIITEEILNRIDPLYPYNHKLLIEGYVYHPDFTGDKKYKGTDKSAEVVCNLTSVFDLENNTQGIRNFALRNIGDDNSYILGALIKIDTSYSDYNNECFLVEWRSSDKLYKYVKLKAELYSSNSSLSPKLESYRIKLGV